MNVGKALRKLGAFVVLCCSHSFGRNILFLCGRGRVFITVGDGTDVVYARGSIPSVLAAMRALIILFWENVQCLTIGLGASDSSRNGDNSKDSE
jgi:hypothetical protein